MKDRDQEPQEANRQSVEKLDPQRFEEVKRRYSEEIKNSKLGHRSGSVWRNPDMELSRNDVFLSAMEVLNLYGLKETVEKIEQRLLSSITKKRNQDAFHKRYYINRVDFLYDFFRWSLMGLSSRARYEKNFFETEDWIETHRPYAMYILPYFKSPQNKGHLEEVFTLAKDVIEG